jgi:diguanylate cyclase (GGDEF)-like protein
MQLDSNTLIFSIGILSLLMAFISWTFPSTIKDREFGLKEWSIGITFVGASLILIFLRSQIHPFFGVFLANVFLMTGGTLGLYAPARFYQLHVPKHVVGPALALGLGGLLMFFPFGYSIAFAMVGVCGAMSIVMIYTVYIVLKHSRKPVPFPAKIFALSMGVMGVAYSIRAIVVLINPNVQVAPASLSGSHQSMLIVGALFVVSSTISFYSVVHDEQKHELAERAKRDMLTGLFNRRAFFEMAEEADQQNIPCSVLMIDIDHFKAINDTHGHLVGDLVLSHAGRLIANSFRIDDICCRFGGEEFCVLLRGCTQDQALQQAQVLLQNFVQQTIATAEGQSLNVTVSIGVAQHQENTSLLKTIQAADQALYHAKRQGRNQVQSMA